MSNSTDHVWDAECGNKVTKKVQKEPDFDDTIPDFSHILSDSESNTVKQSILDLAAERIGLRGAEYPVEDAFTDIAEQVSLWLWQRKRVKLTLTPDDIADMMAVFKRGRRMVRHRAGIYKRDDVMDEIGYLAKMDEMQG